MSKPVQPIPDDAPRDFLLAFVLLRQATRPAALTLAAAYKALAPGGPKLKLAEERDGTLSLELGGGFAAVTLVAAPVPGAEVEAGMRFSASLLHQEWDLEPHHAHLIVTCARPPGATAREHLRTFHRLTAAVAMAAHPHVCAIGVDGITHEPGFYVDQVRSDPDPATVWFGLTIDHFGARFSMLSLGMGRLALPDLLLTAPSDRFDHAFGWFFNVLSHVAACEAALPDGDTIGHSPTERMLVRYVASPRDPSIWVMAIHLP